jgi:restriction system protein
VLAPFLLCVLAVTAIQLWLGRVEERRLAAAGLQDLDRMDGRTFEKAMAGIFRALGWSVERTPHQGDYGADLVLTRNGVRTVVQLKRWSRPVGVRAIQEAVAAKAVYGAERAMVVTSGRRFTERARSLARANGVDLWDRARLLAQTTRRPHHASPLP